MINQKQIIMQCLCQTQVLHSKSCNKYGDNIIVFTGATAKNAAADHVWKEQSKVSSFQVWFLVNFFKKKYKYVTAMKG